MSEPSEEAYYCVDNIMCALQLRLSDSDRQTAAVNVESSIERAIKAYREDQDVPGEDR